MEAWYAVTFDKMDLFEKQMKSMKRDKKGIEYFTPTFLCSEMRRDSLRLRERNMLGCYAFVKIDYKNDYSALMHNKDFPGNIHRILDADTIPNEEIDEWRRLSLALHQPLRISREGYRITNRALSGVKLLRYFGKKRKALIECLIGGRVCHISVAAYKVGDHSAAALKLAAVYRMENKARRVERKARSAGETPVRKPFRVRLRVLVAHLRPHKQQHTTTKPVAPRMVSKPATPAMVSSIWATSAPP